MVQVGAASNGVDSQVEKENRMNCPHCNKPLNIGKLLRSKRPTAAQKEAAKLNGAKGGRPRKTKRPNEKLSV